MKRKKTLLEIGNKIIFTNDIIKISKEGDEWFFEVGRELTNDIAEGVALLMRDSKGTSSIWDTEIIYVNLEEISPEKCLYWLSGGDKEWRTLENYNRPWSECYLDFQEEFGMHVVNIIKKSKTLGDIRKHFMNNLNLPTMYDFAMSRYLLK